MVTQLVKQFPAFYASYTKDAIKWTQGYQLHDKDVANTM